MTVAVTESFHSLELIERPGNFPESEIGKVNDRAEYDLLYSCIPIALQITTVK